MEWHGVSGEAGCVDRGVIGGSCRGMGGLVRNWGEKQGEGNLGKSWEFGSE